MPKEKTTLLIMILLVVVAIIIVTALIWNTGKQPAIQKTADSEQNTQLPPDNSATKKKKESTFTGEIKKFQMTAKQWEFNPSTITVNKGDKVILKIKSLDVAHGFALPTFKVNSRLEPGEETAIEFIADQAGSHTFFSSVFSGAGTKGMRGVLIVR